MRITEIAGELDDDGDDYGPPPRKPEPWLQTWRLYVDMCCCGIPPGAPYSYVAACQSLWQGGAAVNPAEPLRGVQEYLEHRIRQARERGKPIPALRWLVQDLPSWVEMRSRAVPASPPRRPQQPRKPEPEYVSMPAELRSLLPRIGRKP